ncbi:MAG: primosomal protein N' (replication factor Y) - superfamily II helicase [Desulfobulbus sp.]|nr:MAG: primosomal protein N' (replication factor Y) - superfamily II helicase [Desulfobulbus sp.]
MSYAPGTRNLHCDYCGGDTPIDDQDIVSDPIRELPFREALQQLATAEPGKSIFTVQCENCAAEFTLDKNNHAGNCPFCGTPIVVKPGKSRPILPKSLVPFAITRRQAEERFGQWLSSLRFAPGKLKKYGRTKGGLTGVYIPYWTYDSATTTDYTGERGMTYQVPMSVLVTENGRRVRRTVMVTKVRWTPVSGRVSRFFDDVLVGASTTLPRTITDRLKPWNLNALVPFNEAYLSGFESEVYQVHLDDGFNRAVRIMDATIRGDIARDIGGDLQRIHHLDTRHDRITYKHILLPIWSSAFTFGNKTYRFVVNGQSGKVQGERPYSPWKITAAVIAVLAVIGGIALLKTNM